MTRPVHDACGRAPSTTVRGIGLLFLIMAIAIATLTLLTCLSDRAGATTTYIVGEWRINESVVLSDGEWDVSGSVVVAGGTLTLDRARLWFNSSSGSQGSMRVLEGGRLESVDSGLEGGSRGFRLELYGDASLINTTVSTNERDPLSYGIWQAGGTLSARDCTFSDARVLVRSQSDLTVEGCVFSDFGETAIDWRYLAGSAGGTVAVRGSTFQNDRRVGLAISIQGARNDALVKATISNNTFRNTLRSIYCSDFLHSGSGTSRVVLIEDNDAEGCASGLELSGSSAIIARHNRWNMSYAQGIAGTVHLVLIKGSGSPLISDDEIAGGRTGFLIEGYSLSIELRNVSVSGVDVGMVVQYAKLVIRDSRIDAKVHDFELQGFATVRLHDCHHSFRSYVFGSGAISDLAVINFTSVTWQEGTPIDTGVTVFDDGAGAYLAVRDNRNPSLVELPFWTLNETSELRVDRARGAYRVGNVSFYSEPFPVVDVHEMALVIYDRYAPVLSVTSPLAGTGLRQGLLVARGSCTEIGAGMGSVVVHRTGGGWQEADIATDGDWRLVLTGLADGVYTITVVATDRANNTFHVEVDDITVDATLPFIDVLTPPRRVRTTPVELVVRTEPGSTALVNLEPVLVTAEGMFSVLLSLYVGDNGVLIGVEDAVGNQNETSFSIVLDLTPPTLVLTSPEELAWTRQDRVWVNGTVEQGARVMVGKAPVAVSVDGSFSVQAPVVTGESVVSVLAVDEAGNAVRMERRVRCDPEVPVLELLAPVDASFTSERIQTVAGRVVDDSPCVVRVNGREAMLVGERWFEEILLAEGSNPIRVEAVDAAGNTATALLVVVLDTRPPNLDVRLVAHGRHVAPGGTAITTGEAEAMFELFADEAGIVEVEGISHFAIDGDRLITRAFKLVEGMNTLRFSVRDLAGNGGTLQEFTITLDTVAPPLIVLYPQNGTLTRELTIIVHGMCEAGATVSVGGVVATVGGDGGFEATVPLRIGANALRVVASDAVNNSVSSSVAVVREEGWVSAPSGDLDDCLALMSGLVIGIGLSAVILRLSSRKR